MWAILLKILSIIGIVLGSILGVVLIILLLVLLCPIVYKINGNAAEGKFYGKIRISYIFGLIHGGYTYPEPGNIFVKLGFITLFDTGKEKQTKKSRKKHKKDSYTNNAYNESILEEDVYISSSNSGENDSQINENQTATDSGTQTTNPENNNTENNKTNNNKADNNKADNNKADSNKAKQKSKNPIYRIKSAWENFRYKVIVKLKLLYKDLYFYKILITHNDTKSLLKKAKKALVKILKKIAPRKGSCNIIYGMDSPDMTAYIYGLYSVVMHNKTDRYIVTPDFNIKRFEGDISFKGHFNLAGILVNAIPVIFSKDLKLLKARIEKHSENMKTARRKAEKQHSKIVKELDEEYSA